MILRTAHIRYLLTAGLLTLVFFGIVLARAPEVVLAKRPNIVVIQTDDQPLAEFRGAWINRRGQRQPLMPKTKQLIRDRGIEFRQYMTPYPLCAPSRASLWSGQYARNHGVLRIGGIQGDWPAYRTNAIMGENLGVWLQRAGYRTSHYGKFTNHYGGLDAPAETVVPPGWDRWVTDATDRSIRLFYGYRQNIDGRISPMQGTPFYGPRGGRDPKGCPARGLVVCKYHTDALSVRASREIRDQRRDQPFFMQIDYHTPHSDNRPPAGPEPAPRHYGSAVRTARPEPPGFDERDVSDKPWFIRQGAPRMSKKELRDITVSYQKSVEALRSVDEGVARVISALKATGRLKNTYVIFTSDNGFFLGEHRLSRGKLLPYEPALRVPFVMRGPGIRPGTRSQELVANHDVAPTLLELAGAGSGSYPVDGRSLVPFWKQPHLTSRRPILISAQQASSAPGRAGVSIKAPVQNYAGIRIGPWKYVRYTARAEGELYDLARDPHELRNRFGSPRYAQVEAYLARQLELLERCSGASCRTSAPPWPAPPP